MHRRADIINWVMLIIVSVGTTMYLVSASRLVANEQDAAAVWTSVGAYDSVGKKNMSNDEKKSMSIVTLKTNLGSIDLELFSESAPATVQNFLKLIKSGFYDGTRFHRVIKGFMIQGGDPLSKDTALQNRWGQGGPGYKFDDEINPNSEPYITGYKRGILAMANSGPNTNGSQFFIMHQDYPLPPSYTIFGKVISGIEVVDKIANNPTAPGDRPIKDVVIEKGEVK